MIFKEDCSAFSRSLLNGFLDCHAVHVFTLSVFVFFVFRFLGETLSVYLETSQCQKIGNLWRREELDAPIQSSASSLSKVIFRYQMDRPR